MNILHTEVLPKWGGEQNKVIKELLVTKAQGHHVHLICNPNAVIGQRAKKLGIPVSEISMKKNNYQKTIPFFMKFIKENNIDIIFSHGSIDSWIVAIAGNLSSRKPILIRERHNLFLIKGFHSRFLHSHMFDKILPISESVKNYLLEIGVPDSKMTMMPDAVDIEHFKATKPILRSKFHISENDIIIGIFADLSKKKGVFDFTLAVANLFKKYQNITIVFAGSYKSFIKTEVDEIFRNEGIDPNHTKIVWTGRHEDAAEIMKDFDIYIYPSHTEGLGTVILEGMASKLPIIVYDIEPMNELVKNDINGFRVPYKDYSKIAEKTEILIRDADLRKQMGNMSFEFALNNFSEEILYKNMKKLLDAYNV